jgi:hypothetical protein
MDLAHYLFDFSRALDRLTSISALACPVPPFYQPKQRMWSAGPASWLKLLLDILDELQEDVIKDSLTIRRQPEIDGGPKLPLNLLACMSPLIEYQYLKLSSMVDLYSCNRSFRSWTSLLLRRRYSWFNQSW